MRAFFLRVFSLALRVFPGNSSVLPGQLFLNSWRFAFPGDSSVLVVRVSWRFPCPGDSQHVLAGRGLVVLQLQLKVRSWLLLVPPRRLVFQRCSDRLCTCVLCVLARVEAVCRGCRGPHGGSALAGWDPRPAGARA